MTRTRIQWVDIVKFVCIFSVMNSHLESSSGNLRMLYYPFFLPLFLFCSGYVYRHRKGFRLFLQKKVSQLLIPWLVFSVGNILLSQVISFNEQMPLTEALFWNFLQIRSMNDGIWFLAALFVAYIPFYFFVAWYEKSRPAPLSRCIFGGTMLFLFFLTRMYTDLMPPSALPWGCVSLPWHLEYAFEATFYMTVGYLFREHWETAFDQRNTILFRCCIWGIYLAVLLAEKLDTANAPLGFLLETAESLLGCFAVISLCKVIPAGRFVTYIGENTLLYFALHGKVYSLLQTVMKKFLPDIYRMILGNTLLSDVFSIVITMSLCVILLIPVWVINRWFPFLIGRHRKSVR